MTNTKSWPHQKEAQHKLIHASYVTWFWKLASLQELFAGLVGNDLSWRTNPNTHWERIHVQGSLFLSSIFCQHTLTPLLGSGEITHLRGGEYRTLLKQTCSTEEHLLCFLYASYKPGEHRNDSPGTRYKSLTITLRFIYSVLKFIVYSLLAYYSQDCTYFHSVVTEEGKERLSKLANCHRDNNFTQFF